MISILLLTGACIVSAQSLQKQTCTDENVGAACFQNNDKGSCKLGTPCPPGLNCAQVIRPYCQVNCMFSSDAGKICRPADEPTGTVGQCTPTSTGEITCKKTAVCPPCAPLRCEANQEIQGADKCGCGGKCVDKPVACTEENVGTSCVINNSKGSCRVGTPCAPGLACAQVVRPYCAVPCMFSTDEGKACQAASSGAPGTCQKEPTGRIHCLAKPICPPCAPLSCQPGEEIQGADSCGCGGRCVAKNTCTTSNVGTKCSANGDTGVCRVGTPCPPGLACAQVVRPYCAVTCMFSDSVGKSCRSTSGQAGTCVASRTGGVQCVASGSTCPKGEEADATGKCIAVNCDSPNACPGEFNQCLPSRKVCVTSPCQQFTCDIQCPPCGLPPQCADNEQLIGADPECGCGGTCGKKCPKGEEFDAKKSKCVAVNCESSNACVEPRKCLPSRRACITHPCQQFTCSCPEDCVVVDCKPGYKKVGFDQECGCGGSCIGPDERCPTGSELDLLTNNCVPVSCDSKHACEEGTTCVPQDIACIRAPCPQFTCEKKSEECEPGLSLSNGQCVCIALPCAPPQCPESEQVRGLQSNGCPSCPTCASECPSVDCAKPQCSEGEEAFAKTSVSGCSQCPECAPKCEDGQSRNALTGNCDAECEPCAERGPVCGAGQKRVLTAAGCDFCPIKCENIVSIIDEPAPGSVIYTSMAIVAIAIALIV